MTELVGGARSRMTAWQFLRGLAKVVIGGALLLQALLFIVVLSLLMSILGSVSEGMKAGGDAPDVKVASGSALIFNPVGVLSETAPEPDPVEEALNEAFGGTTVGQVSVHDLIRVLETAQADEKIKLVVLDLQNLVIPDVFLSKALLLADAVEELRESGKRVVAISDGYGQNQYVVASEAGEVLMHKEGAVFMTGYGNHRTFYKSMLEKLDVTNNVFRVGTYKSALEPVLRDDMSPEAKEASLAYLEVLWGALTRRIDENRELGEGATDFYANQFVEILKAARGDLATAAQESGYVDRLMTRSEMKDFVSEIVGENEDGELNTVELDRYRRKVKAPKDREDVPNIAVVTVQGAIVDGAQEQGVASGEYISEQLREARENEDVSAVVMRVDSPGGSVFASELIRNEVQAIKEAGKPIVVSMSSLAASGGYWISAPADAIFARETTLTGSIGIFAYLPTFEDLAARFGIFTDGVGTTPFTAAEVIPFGAMPDELKATFQLNIQHGYDQFIDVVADGRGLGAEDVRQIAEGRVWVGVDAEERSLVDRFGGLDDAIADAAARAGIEDWDVVGVVEEKSRFEQFLEDLFTEAEGRGLIRPKRSFLNMPVDGFDRTAVGAAVKLLEKEARFQASFDDPKGIYARCLECGAL
mgnify:CR=1 FL=1